MTTITFIPDSMHQFVNWNDPARWTGGVVPNNPTVDVIIPTTSVISTGDPYISFITESGAFAVGSLAISNNFLLLNGALTVTHDLNISAGSVIDMSAGSSLSAASVDNNGVDIQGQGSITVTGLFLNESELFGQGLSLTTGSLTNTGSLSSGRGDLTVVVTPGGFTNLSGSTLSGGSYEAGFDGNTGVAGLYLNVGNVIATDAANISLDRGGSIYSFDNASLSYVSITSSMHSIAASGTLSLENQSFDWSDLTVDGSLTLTKATLNATHLTIDAGGNITGTGAIGGPIVDNGTIVARVVDLQTVVSDGLVLTGPVSGSGTIEIAEAVVTRHTGITSYVSVPLELAAAASANVFFDDGHGTLTLDDPSEFSGKIRPAAAGDQIVLRGISISSVTSYSYSGDASGGTLAIHTAGGETDLHFLGNFTTSNFTLAAGPQHLSSDPASLLITNSGSAPTVLAPIAEDSGARLITQAELLSGFVGSSPVVTSLAIASGNGALVNNHDGTWSYTAAHNDDSAVSFAYSVTYSGGTVAESATLDITPVNDAPVAANSGAGGAEDITISATVSASDVDNSSSQLSYALVGANGGASHGTVVLHPDGSFSYTPMHDFNGNDSFSFKASDGSLDSNVTTESLTISAVNDAPVNTVPGPLSVQGGLDAAITGLAVSDVDATSLTTTLHVDHGTLAVAAIGGAAIGGSGTATVTLTGSVAQIDAALSAANDVLYHSAFNFSGIDHLTMTSNDGGNSGAGGTLTDTDVVAIQVNDPISPPHLPSGTLGAAVANFVLSGTDVGHTVDIPSPGALALLPSDFHLI